MSEPTGCVRCCAGTDTYCDRCDLLAGLPGLRVVDVADVGGWLTVTVESPPGVQGCRVCGVLAASHGRRTVVLVDAPCFGRAVRVRSLAGRPVALASSGEALELPFVHARQPILAVRGRWADPRVAGNMGVT